MNIIILHPYITVFLFKYRFFLSFVTNVTGGVFARAQDSPFGYNLGEGVDAGRNDLDWIVNSHREKHDATYKSLNPVNGKVKQSGKLLLCRNLYDSFKCSMYLNV